MTATVAVFNRRRLPPRNPLAALRIFFLRLLDWGMLLARGMVYILIVASGHTAQRLEVGNQTLDLGPIGRIQQGWLPEVTLSLGGLLGQDMTGVGLVPQQLSPAGSLEAFCCSLVGL